MLNVSVEKAINYFKRSYASGDTDDERQHNEALDMAIKALERTRWIPISERLPENEQKVLFCTKQGNIHQGTYYADISRWYSNIRSSWIFFDSILAWMPSPQPYEESEDAE